MVKLIIMRKIIQPAILLICFVITGIAAYTQYSERASNKKFQTQTEVALPVKDYGKVYNVPFAVDKPDPNMHYKIVFEVSGEPFDSSHIYPPLEFAARMYNLHVFGGVPQKNMDVVLVIGGFGIPAVMNNEAYKKRYGIDNPNLKLLQQLKDAGIKLNGCAQATLKSLIDPSEVIPEVNVIFSRFTTVSMYQMKGYGYFKF